MAQIDKQSLLQKIDYLLKTNNFSATTEDIKETIKVLNLTPSYPIVLVGGTNGKGSTCAYLTTILSNAGYKVGTFTSPHVFDYNERIKINNQPIDDSTLSESLGSVIDASKVNLGLFKTFTLTCHLIFIAQKIDIAIIEVGLGGAKDTTNLFEPTISAITGVDYDHCDILGNTLEEIGLEKAGIFRNDKPVFYGSSNPPQTVIEYAQRIKSTLNLFGQDFQFKRHDHCWDFVSKQGNLYSLPYPSMRGEEQIFNATLAIAILNQLRGSFPVSIAQIKNGLLQTTLIGRFQVMPGQPQIIFDTAHNPQAIETMYKNMVKLQFAKRNFAVFAIAQDKNWQEIVTKHAKDFDFWYLAPLENNKSADVSAIQELLLQCNAISNNIVISETVSESFTKAYQNLTNEDRLICFGSFLCVEQGYQALKRIRK